MTHQDSEGVVGGAGGVCPLLSSRGAGQVTFRVGANFGEFGESSGRRQKAQGVKLVKLGQLVLLARLSPAARQQPKTSSKEKFGWRYLSSGLARRLRGPEKLADGQRC